MIDLHSVLSDDELDQVLEVAAVERAARAPKRGNVSTSEDLEP